MKFDQKQHVFDNLVEQWEAQSFRDKRETVEDTIGVSTFCFALANSVRCASKGNWPAAFYNLAISGAVVGLWAVAANN